MDKIPNFILDIIHKFVTFASEDHINITELVLFGSYANGTFNEWSDIDIAVVSNDFEGVSFYDSKKCTNAMLKSSIDLEIHPYRPEEFTVDNPFVKEILSYGIRIV